jgi:hypothetical protein
MVCKSKFQITSYDSLVSSATTSSSSYQSIPILCASQQDQHIHASMAHVHSRAPANNMMPYWQLPDGASNVNYHTVPYNYSAQVNWEQHTAAQRMQRRSLQHAQQQNTYTPTTHPHSNNHSSSPAMLYPPTPPTEHGPRDSSKPAHFVPLAPKPARIESLQSSAHSDFSLRTTEYGKMSAMKTAILGTFMLFSPTYHAAVPSKEQPY